jgi:hypothetical protein
MEQGQFIEALPSLRRILALLPANEPLRGKLEQLLQRGQQLFDLDGKLRAVLAGKPAPTDPGSQVQMAILARKPFNRLYLTSARLYRDAFAREPRLADAHRYDAACAAALAGTGQGKDVVNLNDTSRAELRYSALSWLHEGLNTQASQLATLQPGNAERVRGTLLHWQKDPDLAAVRERAALSKLPEAEQVAWWNLWAQVDALLARTRSRK